MAIRHTWIMNDKLTDLPELIEVLRHHAADIRRRALKFPAMAENLVEMGDALDRKIDKLVEEQKAETE